MVNDTIEIGSILRQILVQKSELSPFLLLGERLWEAMLSVYPLALAVIGTFK